MKKDMERALFERWRKERGYSSFVSDGVFHEETWNREPYRITFVLKEPNWPGGTGCLCENIIRCPNRHHWRTWNNIARWTVALLGGADFPGYIPKAERIRQVKRVSFLNLKKVGGDASANSGEIRNYAYWDAGYICCQLLLYKPDLIVCCGKDGSVADILETEVLERCGLPVRNREETKDVSWSYTWFPGKERPTPVVDFLHPCQPGKGYAEWREWYRWMLEVRELLIPRR